MIKYLDVFDYELRAFNFFIGGRGVGKTFSALSHLHEMGEPFIYLRNTDVQMKESATKFGNPFKKLNSVHGWDVRMEAEEGHYNFVEGRDKEKRIIGYGAALSTFGNLRGVDLSDCNFAFFDEFIQRKKLTYNQFDSFFDFYETVNRNREFEEPPKPPFKVIFSSNSQSLNNSILAGFGLINEIERMKRDKVYTYKRKNLCVYLLPESNDVTEAKRQTALYQETAGSRNAKEALDNDFAFDSFHHVRKFPIQEFIGMTAIDGIYIYRHKSNGTIYVCRTPFDCDMVDSTENISSWRRVYMLQLREKWIADRIYFLDFQCKITLAELIKI